MSPAQPEFSYARLAVLSIGAATGVIIVATLVIWLLEPGPGVGLAIAIGGVIGAIAAMGFTATRITNRAFGDPERNE